MDDEARLLCLRCKTRKLKELPSPEEVRFFECPKCGRRYAKRPGRSLTFKWLHPITVALYGVIFEKEPLPFAAATAKHLAARNEPKWVAALIGEIELELADPTQNLADTLDLRASDAKLRAFLQAMHANLQARASRPRRKR